MASWRVSHGDAAGARAARHHFERLLTSIAGESPDIESAAVVFAELIANAIEHGRGDALILLWRQDDELWLVCSDDGPGVAPETACAPGATAIRGRGLHLIKSLALRFESVRTKGRSGLRALLSATPSR